MSSRYRHEGRAPGRLTPAQRVPSAIECRQMTSALASDARTRTAPTIRATGRTQQRLVRPRRSPRSHTRHGGGDDPGDRADKPSTPRPWIPPKTERGEQVMPGGSATSSWPTSTYCCQSAAKPGTAGPGEARRALGQPTSPAPPEPRRSTRLVAAAQGAPLTAGATAPTAGDQGDDGGRAVEEAGESDRSCASSIGLPTRSLRTSAQVDMERHGTVKSRGRHTSALDGKGIDSAHADLHALWFVAALALLIVELHTAAFFAIFTAAGAFAAGVVSFFPRSSRSGSRPSWASRWRWPAWSSCGRSSIDSSAATVKSP